MAVQDPPLVLNKDTQDKFDTNRFKDYTKPGRFVEYVVWPALLLCESGPLLAKGVAQGCEKPLFAQTVGPFPKKKKTVRKMNVNKWLLHSVELEVVINIQTVNSCNGHYK